jgi:hypothetical protein
MQAAEGTAWWVGKTSAVGETDEQLVVIGTGANAGADALKALGRSLQEWQVTRSCARHIWGLEDLLEGRAPRTPPIYLSVPYRCERFEEQFEKVALVFVTAGTDKKVAAHDLARHIEVHLEWTRWGKTRGADAAPLAFRCLLSRYDWRL